VCQIFRDSFLEELICATLLLYSEKAGGLITDHEMVVDSGFNAISNSINCVNYNKTLKRKNALYSPRAIVRGFSS